MIVPWGGFMGRLQMSPMIVPWEGFMGRLQISPMMSRNPSLSDSCTLYSTVARAALSSTLTEKVLCRRRKIDLQYVRLNNHFNRYFLYRRKFSCIPNSIIPKFKNYNIYEWSFLIKFSHKKEFSRIPNFSIPRFKNHNIS